VAVIDLNHMLPAKQTKRDPSVNECLTEGSHGGRQDLKFRRHTSSLTPLHSISTPLLVITQTHPPNRRGIRGTTPPGWTMVPVNGIDVVLPVERCCLLPHGDKRISEHCPDCRHIHSIVDERRCHRRQQIVKPGVWQPSNFRSVRTPFLEL